MKTASLFLPLVLVSSMSAAQDGPTFNLRHCYSAMWSDARSAPVVQRMGVGQSPIPLSLRASKAKATPKEKIALEFVAAEMQSCEKQAQVTRENLPQFVKDALRRFETDTLALLTRTYAGDLTWGGAIEGQDVAAAALDKDLTEFAAAVKAHQQAEVERQAAKEVEDARIEAQRLAALRAEYERQKLADIHQRRLEQERKMQAQEQAQRDFMQGLLLMQAARPAPAPLLPMQAPDISCQSRAQGGTVFTNCR